jgi:hypothetical protein
MLAVGAMAGWAQAPPGRTDETAGKVLDMRARDAEVDALENASKQ